jgi:dipeptidyl-peptidase-4
MADDRLPRPDTFPRQFARTRRFTLGEPRTPAVSPDGGRVVFLRSRSGSDPVTCLWVLDVATGAERLVADPLLLGGAGDEGLPPEERARRERAREQAGGVVTYACDDQVTLAAFALGGALFVADLVHGDVRSLDVAGPVFDPRPDPAGRRVAYVSGRTLRLAEISGAEGLLCADDDADVSWGSAEFVAAEEMDRARGFWWAPDGERLAVARVDVGPVGRWWIADPGNPAAEPTLQRYPAAGTANADVTLHVVGLDGERVEVGWDRAALPYLTGVVWDAHGLLVAVQSRDQRRVAVLVADPLTGATTTRWEDTDDTWVELVPGVPARLADGRLVTCADRGGARRLCIDGSPVTPPELQVRAVAHVGDDHVLVQANPLDDPTVLHVHRWSADGLVALTAEPGVHGASAGGATVVVRSASLRHDGTVTRVGDHVVTSHAEAPLLDPRPSLHVVGERHLRAAVLVPAGHDGTTPLPVLLDPYGGPHAQRVQQARAQFLTSQWFADQGFAVVVIDGRGTPGRGSAWERSVHLDLASPALDDQVDGLLALAEQVPFLDLGRVAIRGWSFGGYLAALAVLRRPDVVHAAVAGAPVTEWRLYDTHYTERYLGDPATSAAAYDRSSLLADAARLERPLMLVHGLADDNVVVAHTVRLSSALLVAGRPHEVLPLSGVTHMAPQEQVTENLLRLQLHFLQRHLA